MPSDAVVAARPIRPPQDNIPQTRQQRDRLWRLAGEYVREARCVGPLSVAELREHAGAVLNRARLSCKYLDYTAVLVNNEVWRRKVAGIPFEKRLLLLPKCLRDAKQCPAEFDEVGLLCEHCGRCLIDGFKSRAEELGYAVLIAEGSPVVMSLIESGRIETVIGVSCLSVLERVFPYMEAGAVPGLAIPLLQDGCANTSVDVDRVWDAIYLTGDDGHCRLDLEGLRQKVNGWFTEESLRELLAGDGSQAAELALAWMARVGKRWRPFLVACVHEALAGGKDGERPAGLRKAAVAVECFHKASLIHDDIEDGDDLRYGQKTLHAEYGIPIALNVGDLLLGEGYRLLVELDAADGCKTKMLAAAVQGHRSLCLGQGSELCWVHQPRPLGVDAVIEIFRKKTSPAFEVALKLGALLAGGDEGLNEVFEQYSRSLGVAYQIRDDIDDFRSGGGAAGVGLPRPSLLSALAYQGANRQQKKLLESAWGRPCTAGGPAAGPLDEIDGLLRELEVERVAWNLMESYKSRAIASLHGLQNSELKALLRRVVGKIFNDFEVMGCCNDHQAGHARGRFSGAESSG